MVTYIDNIKFTKCILNASGPISRTYKQLELLQESQLGGIVTKSCTYYPKSGNLLPNYYYDYATFTSINNIGLDNFGINYYINYLKKLKTSKPIFLSIAEHDTNLLSRILTEYLNTDLEIDELLIEYNLGYNQLGYDLKEVERRLKIFGDYFYRGNYIPFGIKIPPYLNRKDLDKLVTLVNSYKDIIRFVTCSYSLPNGCLISEDGKPRIQSSYGDIGGTPLKPIALSNVKQLSLSLDKTIKVIGCGGINTKQDVQDYLKAGASLVQVGTCLFENGLTVLKDL